MANYTARWISKDRAHLLKKTGKLSDGLVLSSLKGFIIVEPSTCPLGDGPTLSRMEADSEVDPAWCLEPKTKVSQARRLLSLDGAFPTPRRRS
jgi:hypothetical protein